MTFLLHSFISLKCKEEMVYYIMLVLNQDDLSNSFNKINVHIDFLTFLLVILHINHNLQAHKILVYFKTMDYI